MQIRRSIAGLERAPAYPRRASRKWCLYGFCSPEMLAKALASYRTYFNLAKGQDGKTTAMRIGLAKRSSGSRTSCISARRSSAASREPKVNNVVQLHVFHASGAFKGAKSSL